MSKYNLREKDKYKSTNKLNYQKLKNDYETDTFTSINIGSEIVFINDNLNYSNFIKQIDRVLSD